MTFLPKFIHIKLNPFQALHFNGQTHTADDRGYLQVPYDAGKAMIDDPQHPAQAVPDEMAVFTYGAEPEAPVIEAPVVAAPVIEQPVIEAEPAPAPEGNAE